MLENKLREVLQITTNLLTQEGFSPRKIYGLQLEDHPENEGDNEVFLFRYPIKIGLLLTIQEVGIIFDTTLSSQILGTSLAQEILGSMR